MGNPPDKKPRKDDKLILLYKCLQCKVKIPADDLIQNDVAKFNTQWPITFSTLNGQSHSLCK